VVEGVEDVVTDGLVMRSRSWNISGVMYRHFWVAELFHN
jgi:hypothetical protein